MYKSFITKFLCLGLIVASESKVENKYKSDGDYLSLRINISQPSTWKASDIDIGKPSENGIAEGTLELIGQIIPANNSLNTNIKEGKCFLQYLTTTFKSNVKEQAHPVFPRKWHKLSNVKSLLKGKWNSRLVSSKRSNHFLHKLFWGKGKGKHYRVRPNQNDNSNRPRIVHKQVFGRVFSSSTLPSPIMNENKREKGFSLCSNNFIFPGENTTAQIKAYSTTNYRTRTNNPMYFMVKIVMPKETKSKMLAGAKADELNISQNYFTNWGYVKSPISIPSKMRALTSASPIYNEIPNLPIGKKLTTMNVLESINSEKFPITEFFLSFESPLVDAAPIKNVLDSFSNLNIASFDENELSPTTLGKLSSQKLPFLVHKKFKQTSFNSNDNSLLNGFNVSNKFTQEEDKQLVSDQISNNLESNEKYAIYPDNNAAYNYDKDERSIRKNRVYLVAVGSPDKLEVDSQADFTFDHNKYPMAKVLSSVVSNENEPNNPILMKADIARPMSRNPFLDEKNQNNLMAQIEPPVDEDEGDDNPLAECVTSVIEKQSLSEIKKYLTPIDIVQKDQTQRAKWSSFVTSIDESFTEPDNVLLKLPERTLPVFRIAPSNKNEMPSLTRQQPCSNIFYSSIERGKKAPSGVNTKWNSNFWRTQQSVEEETTFILDGPYGLENDTNLQVGNLKIEKTDPFFNCISSIQQQRNPPKGFIIRNNNFPVTLPTPSQKESEIEGTYSFDSEKVESPSPHESYSKHKDIYGIQDEEGEAKNNNGVLMNLCSDGQSRSYEDNDSVILKNNEPRLVSSWISHFEPTRDIVQLMNDSRNESQFTQSSQLGTYFLLRRHGSKLVKNTRPSILPVEVKSSYDDGFRVYQGDKFLSEREREESMNHNDSDVTVVSLLDLSRDDFVPMRNDLFFIRKPSKCDRQWDSDVRVNNLRENDISKSKDVPLIERKQLWRNSCSQEVFCKDRSSLSRENNNRWGKSFIDTTSRTKEMPVLYEVYRPLIKPQT